MKTPSARANINARTSFTVTRARWHKLDTLMQLVADGHTIERATLNAFGHSEYMRGFDAGVRDATGEDD